MIDGHSSICVCALAGSRCHTACTGWFDCPAFAQAVHGPQIPQKTMVNGRHFFFGKNRFAIAGKWTLYILVLLPPDVGCGDWHPLPHMPRWDCHVFHSGFHVDRWHAATTFFQFWGPNRVQGDFVANSVVTVVTSSFSTLDIWSNPEIYPGIIHAHASCHAISKIKPFLACQAQMSSARAPPPRSGVSVSGSGERYLLDRMISCWLFVVYICRR